MENKRLHTIGEVERKKRVGRPASKKKQLLGAAVVGPSIVPKIADSHELRPGGAVVGAQGIAKEEAQIFMQEGQAEEQAPLAGQGVQTAGLSVPSAQRLAPDSNRMTLEEIHFSSAAEPIHIQSPDRSPMEGMEAFGRRCAAAL